LAAIPDPQVKPKGVFQRQDEPTNLLWLFQHMNNVGEVSQQIL
jgi:hypothetical protein